MDRSFVNLRKPPACILALASLLVGACIAYGLAPQPSLAAVPLLQSKEAFVAQVRRDIAREPVVAVLAHNDGTEITDFLVPHALLARSGVARVEAVALRRGAVALLPSPLVVQVPSSLADFDQRHPGGADYVVVPAMQVDDEPALLAWIRQQADKGATIVGVCSGARVLGRAGLLDGRRFTGHWDDRRTLKARHPTATHAPGQRYLADQGVVTTTGVSASIPVSLALVEAMGGASAAHALAQQVGAAAFGPEHASEAFGLTALGIAVYLANQARGWLGDHMVVRVESGADDIRLALAMDAWSRTHRLAGLVVQAAGDGTQEVRLGSGLAVALPPAGTRRTAAPPSLDMPLYADTRPAQVLHAALCDIARRYGAGTRDWVALEMEHPQGGGADRCLSAVPPPA